MSKDKEQEFLHNIAKVLGRKEPLTDAPAREEVGPPAFWKEQKFETSQPLEMFKNNMEALSGRVHIARDSQEVSLQIKLWLQELNAKAVIMWDHPELKEYVRIEDANVKIDYWTPGQPGKKLIEAAEKADVGITWADYAIGYTGTLALFGQPFQGRAVSLLPPTHIAIFKKSNLVATMSTVMRDLINRKGKNNLPTAVDFITGPSRTSDIEMDLSIGVHGPYRVWTIIVDDQTRSELIAKFRLGKIE